MFEIQGKYTKATILADTVEDKCIDQIYNMVNHPAFTEPVAIMPDCHAGMGSVIGFTMPLTDMVIPNVVGVDIGCGMRAVKIEKPKHLDLPAIDTAIRQRIPFGHNVHETSSSINQLDEGHIFYAQAQQSLDVLWFHLKEKFGNKIPAPPKVDHRWFQELCKRVDQSYQRTQLGIGTLGGGNHFIEFGTSSIDENLLWVIIHSGSRQLGKKICEYHQNIAVQQMKNATEGDYQIQIEHIKRTSHTKDIQKKIQELRAKVGIASGIKQKGLESLSGKPMYDYLYDMAFAQCYATLNRDTIAHSILDLIVPKPQFSNRTKPRIMDIFRVSNSILEQIETVHNHISPKDLIIRKGAVAAHKEKIVIPFNMRDGTWICIGQADPKWNFSAPHGAGRLMSRSKAKATLQQADAEKAMDGIYTSVIPLDEAPAAYKDASEIQRSIGATAAYMEGIKPIMNLKAK